MSHFIQKCKECDVTITQCRCPDPNKTIEYSICESCKKKMVAKVFGNQVAESQERADRAAFLEKEIRGVMEQIPESCRIYVREGAGNEDLVASLAVSVAKLVYKLENK